jgi:hypothetical protein
MNVSGKIQKFRASLMLCLNAAPIRSLALFLFSGLLLTGCSTALTYKPNMAAGPARPVGYPIPVYTEHMTVPRPCEVIGTISIGDRTLTMFGGSFESEMEKVMQNAWEKGADAVQVTSVEKPDFTDSNYRLVADLLRYSDAWETVVMSEQGFVNYLKTNQQNLDPIEGVWDGDGQTQHRLGIMRDTSKAGRDFIGFILDTKNPVWREGYKKIDIQRGVQPGSYVFDYYRDNFSRRETTVILGENLTFTLTIPTADEEANVITYSKSR